MTKPEFDPFRDYNETNFNEDRGKSDRILKRQGSESSPEGTLLVPKEIIDRAREEMNEILATQIPENLEIMRWEETETKLEHVGDEDVKGKTKKIMRPRFYKVEHIAGADVQIRGDLAELRHWKAILKPGEEDIHKKYDEGEAEIIPVIKLKGRIYYERKLSEYNEEYLKEVIKYLPAEQRDYIESISNKHWGATTGSRFLNQYYERYQRLGGLLYEAIRQRGGLDGDDREVLAEMGVDPQALMAECRYLVVKTPGEVGIVKASELPGETPVRVVRTKPGTPCSLVIDGEDFPGTDIGTIIIGPNEKQKPDDPEPTTKEMIWTAHPGLPIRPAKDDSWPEGSTITVAEVKAKLGENTYLQFERKSSGK